MAAMRPQTARVQGVSTDALALLAAPNAPTDARPSHDPPLAVREEAIYLLHIAAEVEHALMVQYLYAAYSLGGPQVPPEDRDRVRRWRESILGIAREEMGHLVTVQNILLLLGGPLTLSREDFPVPADLYPFTFRLEPLTQRSLAKYVIAEMPDESNFQPGTPEREELDRIKKVAQLDNDDIPVDRVGILYQQIIDLLNAVASEDFDADSVRFQARPDEWGLGYQNLIILSASNLAEAQAALRSVAEQGEGASMDPTPPTALPVDPSHFGRFLNVYRQFPDAAGWVPSHPVPTNPTTASMPHEDPDMEQGRITNEQTRMWGQLFNLRYKMLLLYLLHACSTSGRLTANEARTPRGLLVSWAFGEMYNLRSIADILTTLPQHEDGSLEHVGGAPFEMPYSLALPDREASRWRFHRDSLTTSMSLTAEILKHAEPAHRPYLHGLQGLDQAAQNIIFPIIGG
ncbi:MAG TPA: ferritin-like domain-containing protein [Chloroflexia bacterium]|jgi:hypothetical protein